MITWLQKCPIFSWDLNEWNSERAATTCMQQMTDFTGWYLHVCRSEWVYCGNFVVWQVIGCMLLFARWLQYCCCGGATPDRMYAPFRKRQMPVTQPSKCSIELDCIKVRSQNENRFLRNGEHCVIGIFAVCVHMNGGTWFGCAANVTMCVRCIYIYR